MSEPQTVSFQCPECKKKLRAPVAAAGRMGKCNACGSSVRIPRTGPADTAAKSVELRGLPKKMAHDTPSKRKATVPGQTSASTGTASQRAVPVSKSAADQAAIVQATNMTTNRPVSGRPPGKKVSPDIGEIGAGFLSSEDLASAIDEAEGLVKRQATAIEAAKVTPQEIANAFVGTLPKRTPSLAYRVHLLLVAAVMILLPLVYVALVIAAAVGVGYYTITILPYLMGQVRVGRAALVIYAAIIAPSVAGTILVVFMIKPLLFRIQSDSRRRSLTRKGEPMLFELVDRICDAVGAPRPVRIDVDYQVNASAQPIGGLFSVATGKMVLTIGVPLFTGLTARQLAGVLAHEFGHFSQKAGMGAILTIQRVSWWFTRIVYQRDTLDVMLEEAIDESDFRIGLVLQLGQLCVFISRGILWCFMVLCRLISAGLLRQMEFDADRYEYGLVGSRVFAETARELRLLAIVQAQTLQQMYGISTKGHLADDMMLMSEINRQQLPHSVITELNKSVAEERGSLLATHPIDRLRVERARNASAEGVFRMERPARELVRHYKALCTNVTWDFYRDHLGRNIRPDKLTPTDELLE